MLLVLEAKLSQFGFEVSHFRPEPDDLFDRNLSDPHLRTGRERADGALKPEPPRHALGYIGHSIPHLPNPQYAAEPQIDRHPRLGLFYRLHPALQPNLFERQ